MKARTLGLALVTAAALLGTAACGNDADPSTGAPLSKAEQQAEDAAQQKQTRSGERPPGASSGERQKPLVDQFKEARARASSSFEKQALDRAIASGTITAADYEEAFSRYRQCAKDAGVQESYTKQEDGFYKIDPPADLKDVDRYMDTTGVCAKNAGLMSLEALYRTQIDNPDLLANPQELVVRCLIKAGLVKSDYTTDKLMAFVRGGMTGAKDFDPADAEAQKCFTAGGMAVNVAPGTKGGS